VWMLLYRAASAVCSCVARMLAGLLFCRRLREHYGACSLPLCSMSLRVWLFWIGCVWWCVLAISVVCVQCVHAWMRTGRFSLNLWP
jgi:hypothetical protein